MGRPSVLRNGGWPPGYHVICDAVHDQHKQLEATKDTEYPDREDHDEYTAANIFWVPKEARIL